jgi:hypothetical protein
VVVDVEIAWCEAGSGAESAMSFSLQEDGNRSQPDFHASTYVFSLVMTIVLSSMTPFPTVSLSVETFSVESVWRTTGLPPPGDVL